MDKDDISTNGQSNAQVNGQSNGYSNGQTNGHSGGQSNGHSKGTPYISEKAAPVALPGRSPTWKYKGAKERPSRKELDKTLGALTNLIHASNKPLPSPYGDGKERKSVYDEKYQGKLADIRSLWKDGHLLESYTTLKTLAKHKRKPGYTDDKTYIVGCLAWHAVSKD